MPSKSQQEEVSLKSTKQEILAAYQEALDKLKSDQKENIKKEKAVQEESELVQRACDTSKEQIIQNLASVKLNLTKTIDELESSMSKEFTTLSELQASIQIITKELDDLYAIKANADSLNVLILAQKERKETFEREMDNAEINFSQKCMEREAQWKKEQEKKETEFKDQMEETKKKRQREEEEYQYNLKLARKKEEDVYAARKEALEKELNAKRTEMLKDLTERETILTSQEKELKELRERAGKFPAELERAMKEAEQKVKDKLTYEYKFQMEMTAKEIEGERKLNQQKIAALESKIKEQDAFIAQLTGKADTAGRQVQEIAMKTIEGAAVSISRNYAEIKKPVEAN